MATSTRTIPTEPAAFLAWENRQKLRYELVHGVVRAMTGGTEGHNRITQNMAYAIRSRLGGRGCFVYASDLKVVSPTGMVTYPAVVVRCGPVDEDATEVDDPVVIAEVLSPNTRSEDLIRKRYGYQAIASLRSLLYVEPKKVQVEVVTRESDDSWRSVFLRDLDAVVRLDGLDVELPLRELYDGLAAAAVR